MGVMLLGLIGAGYCGYGTVLSAWVAGFAPAARRPEFQTRTDLWLATTGLFLLLALYSAIQLWRNRVRGGT